MNERIKQLAEQASDIKDEFGNWIGRELEEEKFDMLIVSECANFFFLKDTLDDHLTAEQLDEHFGDEE